MDIVSSEYIDELIVSTLKEVEDNDKFLLYNKVHETTIVFRFAHYLANKIENDYSDYRVDIEYNRDKDQVKVLDNKIVRIDLIVHKRGTKDNLVAIEFKKNNNSLTDKERLGNLFSESEYKYKNVYFITFNENKIEKYKNNEWEIIVQR